MLQFHKDHHALATLAVQSRPSSRQLLFDNHDQLRARASSTVTPDCAPRMTATQNPLATISAAPQSGDNARASASEAPLHPFAFSGIHLISPRLLPLLTETGIFSIIDSYLRLAAQSHPIIAFRADHYYWRDLGRPSDLTQAALDMLEKLLP
jgi:hypothetical protein